MQVAKKLSWSVWMLLVACIDPYDYPFKEQNNYLVVEGAVTTEPGPYAITLTTTRNINNEENAFKLREQNARVIIATSSGKVEKLVEKDTSGVYYTSASFRGQIGESYQLTVTLENGMIYKSEEVELLPMPPIDSIGIKYGSQKYVSQANAIVDRKGFYITAFVNDPPETENAYLVNWDYTYKIFTHPELANYYDAEGCECWVSSPKECCAVCWVQEESPDFAVANDRLNNGSSLTQYDLFFLPVVGIMLYEKIHLEVSISSLSKDAYFFWNSVYDSRYSQGGLFDPTPNTVEANVYNVEDKEELVLGYFYASDVRKISRSIHPTDFPERIDTDTGYPDTCLLYPNATAEEPEYWNE
ncbi:DUF4249 domain-containing protein [uncultured Imperialibacter sp.]|uniref:DUF4249 domain-containing protein n=1 Tax=uncultured Imperialibacter sp. TaxID=1672639 RepID=UPI0030DCDC44|tara:strand:- start:5969 stop:7039 length:1071 start_codon:yes stop_codon:yes gene_type:complete